MLGPVVMMPIEVVLTTPPWDWDLQPISATDLRREAADLEWLDWCERPIADDEEFDF
jgi:hypothetical protein